MNEEDKLMFTLQVEADPEADPKGSKKPTGVERKGT